MPVNLRRPIAQDVLEAIFILMAFYIFVCIPLDQVSCPIFGNVNAHRVLPCGANSLATILADIKKSIRDTTCRNYITTELVWFNEYLNSVIAKILGHPAVWMSDLYHELSDLRAGHEAGDFVTWIDIADKKTKIFVLSTFYTIIEYLLCLLKAVPFACIGFYMFYCLLYFPHHIENMYHLVGDGIFWLLLPENREILYGLICAILARITWCVLEAERAAPAPWENEE